LILAHNQSHWHPIAVNFTPYSVFIHSLIGLSFAHRNIDLKKSMEICWLNNYYAKKVDKKN
jgi:hypothetical protein